MANKHLKEEKLNLFYYNSGKNKKKKNKNIKAKNKNEKEEKDIFDFDNEIVIGVNVLPKEEKTKKNKKLKKSKTKNKNEENKITEKNNTVKRKMVKKQSKKANPNKKKNSRNMKNIFRVIKIILLIGIVVGIIIFAMTTPIFNITQIDVTGNTKLNSTQIESLSQIELNTNTFRYSKNSITSNIKENAYIDDVEIKRKLPNKISISVKERTPAYLVQYGSSYAYIDERRTYFRNFRTKVGNTNNYRINNNCRV